MKYNIKKSITRKVNTGSYENIMISVEIEKEIECAESEVNYKLDELSKQVLEDYISTHNMVMDELGISEKRAWQEQGKVISSVPSSEELKNIFGEEND
jgi:arsenate reductase-like glutaredoxin family protein